MTDPKNNDCKQAFEKWLTGRAISVEKDKDSWGQEKYKHSHVDAMWCGWLNSWNTRPTQPIDDPAMVKYGNELVSSLEELTSENMKKYFEPLSSLFWWWNAKTRIDNWNCYLRLAPKPQPIDGQNDKYNLVMQLIQNTQMEHGLCQPRERQACTACNAKDVLIRLSNEWASNIKIVRS